MNKVAHQFYISKSNVLRIVSRFRQRNNVKTLWEIVYLVNILPAKLTSKNRPVEAVNRPVNTRFIHKVNKEISDDFTR